MKKLAVLIITVVLSLTGVFSAFAAGVKSPTPQPKVIVIEDVELPDGTKMNKPTETQKSDYYEESQEKTQDRGFDPSKYINPKITAVEMVGKDVQDGWYYVLIETPEPEKETIISDISYNEIIVARQEAEAVRERMENYVPEVTDKAKEKGYKPEECYVYSIEDWTFYEVHPDHIHDTEFPGAQVKVYPGDIKDKFICLLHRDHNTQEWEMIETSWDGKDLVFNLPANLSPFAIICASHKSPVTPTGGGSSSVIVQETEAPVQAPKTGDNTLLWFGYAAGAVVLMLGAAYVLVNGIRRNRRKQ